MQLTQFVFSFLCFPLPSKRKKQIWFFRLIDVRPCPGGDSDKVREGEEASSFSSAKTSRAGASKPRLHALG